ncbi:YbdD/YjiX family protein [Microbacterium sp. 3J1]|uniref:YbdD/YjiX family protein n=1 Tax=Microbacterium sp. 3J1 TaxID=861269 RepID=UPI000A526D78|nr:YbdD/YjiX family protein [Microbacterium sp. 3J1]
MVAVAADRARRVWHAVAWYLNGLTGQSRYADYVAHERSQHPDREPLSEREFWRRHYASQDADPGARCC